jgi:hypothetical protein
VACHRCAPPLARSDGIATLSEKLRQLGDVRCNPSRLIFAEQLCRRAPPRLFLEIDIDKLLAVVVAHDKAGVQFFDRPGRREATCGHGAGLKRYSVTGITERMTGLLDCGCKETWRDHHEDVASGYRVRDRNGLRHLRFRARMARGKTATTSALVMTNEDLRRITAPNPPRPRVSPQALLLILY